MDKELLVELEEAVVDVEGTLAHKNDEESMDELLRNWNLHHLKDFFKDEAITTDVLKLMTYGDLQELLQKLKFGERVIFRSSYEKWKADHNITIFSQTMPIGSRCFSSSPTLSILSQSSECFSEKSQIKVINILKQHNIGCRIIDNYEHTKKLTEEHRNSLLNIIIEYFDSRAIPMTLQTTHRLENEIIDCFPTEKIEFYRNDKRGKLYIKYHNKKRILKSLENTESSKETGNDKENVHNLLISEPEGHVLAQSLKFDNLSVEEFSATWAACAKYRLNQIMKESKSITQILKMWPQYKGSNGFKLIDHDFSVIHSTASTMLQWDAKWEKICDYLTTRQNICDKKVKEVVLFLKNNWTEEGKDNFCLQMLWCIHYFLYSTKKYVRRTVDGKKETARYSLRDSQESFVFIGSTMQELEERMEFLQSKGEPIQPFILGVGDPKAINVTECFVYLDTHLLKVNSFCRALDICFKCHHIFNVEYSQSSMPFWIFVEKYLYGISTGKNNISKLSILLNEISNIL